jgi:hypothetical protein
VPVGAQPGRGERVTDRGRRHQPDRRALAGREAARPAPVDEQRGEFARVVEVAERAGPAEHRRAARVVARRERRHRVELVRQHDRGRVQRAVALEQPVARALQQVGRRREPLDPRAHRGVAVEAGRGQRVGEVAEVVGELVDRRQAAPRALGDDRLDRLVGHHADDEQVGRDRAGDVRRVGGLKLLDVEVARERGARQHDPVAVIAGVARLGVGEEGGGAHRPAGGRVSSPRASPRPSIAPAGPSCPACRGR